MIATIYNPATGEFLWTIEAEPEVIAAQTSRGWVAGVWSQATHYVVDGATMARPMLGIAAMVSARVGQAVAVANVPAGTLVRHDGAYVGEIGPEIPLSFDMPDVYDITLIPPFPWRECSVSVTVT